jgi:hypothetical protein
MFELAGEIRNQLESIEFSNELKNQICKEYQILCDLEAKKSGLLKDCC